MRKLINADDFVIAFAMAIGYAVGIEIPMLFGLPAWLCFVICFAWGGVMGMIVERIVYSKAVQKKTGNRVAVFGVIILAFLIIQYFLAMSVDVSITDYLMEEFGFVIVIPVVCTVFGMVRQWYHERKIRMRYGDGSGGFVFDVTKEAVDNYNRHNQPVSGEYDSDCAVRTKTGIYVGEKEWGVITFLGIPYAKPPVGRLRWKAPQPLDASEEVFEAKHMGASAIQAEAEGSILKHHRQSEDCLTLNIFTSKKRGDSLKPVIVLFHHGDFSYGGSADPLLYGEEFVRSHPDHVIVSFNFRLGIFGFIDFSEIPGGEACPDALNLGLLDQIAALHWIRENIAAFGGDPDRITAMGFEAGAASVSLLAVCDKARGLFKKAYVFCGSPFLANETPSESRELAKKLLEETKTASMEELMALPAEELRAAAQRLRRNMPAPACGGGLIPENVAEAYRSGAASGIEFILCIPKSEGQIYRSFIGTKNYRDIISANFAPGDEERDVILDRWNAEMIFRSAEMLKEGGSIVRLMYWDAEPLIEKLGSGSVDVITAILGNIEAGHQYGSMPKADLSEILRSFLIKFVNGERMRLYNNELRGIKEINWKVFPKALIVSDDDVCCEPIEDKLREDDMRFADQDA